MNVPSNQLVDDLNIILYFRHFQGLLCIRNSKRREGRPVIEEGATWLE